MAATFTAEYEAAAAAQTEDTPLPFMSPTGFWLQSYGFSKACLGAYSQILAREQPSLLSLTCSPGWVATEMSSTYVGDAVMRSVDEGGALPARLAVGDRDTVVAVGDDFLMEVEGEAKSVAWVAD